MRDLFLHTSSTACKALATMMLILGTGFQLLYARQPGTGLKVTAKVDHCARTISLQVTGGTAPYTYQWKDPAGNAFEPGYTDQKYTGFAQSGTYTVIIKDRGTGAAQKTLTQTSTLRSPLKVEAEVVDVNADSKQANIGAISLKISGGQAYKTKYEPEVFYKYRWFNVGTGKQISDKKDISALTTGDYRVEVRDRSGCKVEKTYTIKQGKPIISLSASRLDFGEVAINQSPSKSFTISNTGTVRLQVSKIDFPEGFSGDWTKGSIPAGGKQAVKVTFKPTAKDYSATITVSSNASNATEGKSSLAVSGKGIGSILSMPEALDFGTLVVNKTASKTVTIANTGNRPLNIDVVEHPLGFTGKNWPISIAAGAQQEVQITFAPTSAKDYTSAIKLVSDATVGSKQLPVKGSGKASIPVISLSESRLDFKETLVDGTDVKVLKIANTGVSALTVSAITYPVGFTGNWPGGIIVAGEEQQVDITFSPPEGREYQGVVTVESNAGAGRNTVEVAGKGKALVTGITAKDGTSEPKLSSVEFKVFPNPAEEVLQVKLPNQTSAVDIQLVDVNGQVVYERKAVTGDELSIDVSGYKSGVYVLVVESGGSGTRVAKRKVVIR